MSDFFKNTQKKKREWQIRNSGAPTYSEKGMKQILKAGKEIFEQLDNFFWISWGQKFSEKIMKEVKRATKVKSFEKRKELFLDALAELITKERKKDEELKEWHRERKERKETGETPAEIA